MFLKEIFGLSAFGALLIVAAPAQQAQAATMVSPGNVIGQSDAGMLTIKVHHINDQLDHQSQYGRNLRHRQQHWRNHHHNPNDFYEPRHQHHQHHQHHYFDQYHEPYFNYHHHGH